MFEIGGFEIIIEVNFRKDKAKEKGVEMGRKRRGWGRQGRKKCCMDVYSSLVV